MRALATSFALLMASPAFAASGPFFSLGNTNFIVTLGFILFILVLFYFKVPGMIGKMLDQRAEGIKNELDEARALRDEAQAILHSEAKAVFKYNDTMLEPAVLISNNHQSFHLIEST